MDTLYRFKKIYGGIVFLLLPLVSFASTDVSELFSDIPTTPHVLDVTIVGDKYADMNMFRQDAEKFKTNLLMLEPFKTRAQDFVFHILENTVDLNCTGSIDEEHLARCNNEAVAGVIKNSGIPTDKILVLVNGINSGSGDSLSYAVSGNDPSLAIHEFGHLFGLADEYDKKIDNSIAPEGYFCWANCCFTSACVDWKNVEGAECIPGCGKSSWYRSSNDSIMRTINPSGSFNLVSRNVINKGISEYVTGAAIHISMDFWKEHPFIKGSLYMNGEVTTSDADAITKIEIYVDDTLFASKSYYPPNPYTEFVSPGVYKHLSIGPLLNSTLFQSESSHTIFEKAYDAAGNVGISEKVLLTFDNTPPIISVAEPSDGSLVSGMVPVKFSWSDISGIARIEAYVDGFSYTNLLSAASSFIWHAESLEPGSKHTLYAKAYDNTYPSYPLSNVATSKPITVTIANKPEISKPLSTIPPIDNAVQPMAIIPTAPPIISNVKVVSIGVFGATITWDTDEDASSEVEIFSGLCNGKPCWNPPEFLGPRTKHSLERSGLSPNTQYAFRVKSQNAGGVSVSPTYIFSTLANQDQTTHPQVPTIFMFVHALKRGAKNSEIAELQKFLARFSDLYPEGLITGYFGYRTEAAVKKFQAKFGIEMLGIVGPKTRSKLNELNR